MAFLAMSYNEAAPAGPILIFSTPEGLFDSEIYIFRMLSPPDGSESSAILTERIETDDVTPEFCSYMAENDEAEGAEAEGPYTGSLKTISTNWFPGPTEADAGLGLTESIVNTLSDTM
jgi:hypothetical protein